MKISFALRVLSSFSRQSEVCGLHILWPILASSDVGIFRYTLQRIPNPTSSLSPSLFAIFLQLCFSLHSPHLPHHRCHRHHHPINNSKNLTFLSSTTCLSFSFAFSPPSSLLIILDATTLATPLITPNLQASFPSFGNFFLNHTGIPAKKSAEGDLASTSG